MWTGVRWKTLPRAVPAKWRGTTDAGLLVLAITRRQGLAGMADGLGSLIYCSSAGLTSGRYRYIPEYPAQLGHRKNAAGTENAGYSVQDLPQIYRCVQHLSAIETTLNSVNCGI